MPERRSERCERSGGDVRARLARPNGHARSLNQEHSLVTLARVIGRARERRVSRHLATARDRFRTRLLRPDTARPYRTVHVASSHALGKRIGKDHAGAARPCTRARRHAIGSSADMSCLVAADRVARSRSDTSRPSLASGPRSRRCRRRDRGLGNGDPLCWSGTLATARP